MADSTLPNLDAVTTPVATDLFGVRQVADTRDKKMTRAQVHTLGATEHLILPQVSEVATPTLAFGDGDTGFHETADDVLNCVVLGVNKWIQSATAFKSGDQSQGWSMPNVAPSGTVPAYAFGADANTGIGWAGTDKLSLIAGGKEAVRYAEASAHVIASPYINAGLTAHVGSSQGDLPILSSYNIFSTVANAGDAATLPSFFLTGTKIWVKNDGANSMDVFPSAGIDAGAGANIAIAVPAGTALLFVADATGVSWTTFAAAETWDGTGYPLLAGREMTDADVDSDALGFSVWWNTTDTPGNGDGAVLAMNYDATYEAQMYLDWDHSGGGLYYRSNYDDAFSSWRQVQFMVDNFEIHTKAQGLQTAHVGSSQGDGLLVNSYTFFGTVGTTGDACTLPAIAGETLGMKIYIANSGANSMDVFPNTNDNIIGSADNIAVALAAGDWVEYMCDTTQWLKVRGGTV